MSSLSGDHQSNTVSGPSGFVGRRLQLRILQERLIAARSGQPQVVCVEGEPGAGKSALLAHFLDSLSDAAIVEVSGDEEETLLSYGIVDQLQRMSNRNPGLDPMGVGVQLLALLDRLQNESQVVVLAIDDLQWADRPSLRALLFALRRLRADRVLTVATTRIGGLTEPGWARFVAGDSRVTRLRLAGLTSADLRELAKALGLGALSEQGASRLAAHTQGNPLYSRALLDEIGVTGLGAVGDAGLPAPRDLSAVILTRISALSPDTQTFIAAASVLGHHAPASRIAAVARLPEAQNEVDAAVAAGILTEQTSATELTFSHPLYRAAVYADLSPTTRRALHERAAELVAGHSRLVHQVAASLGPNDALATALEVSGRTSAAAHDYAASAWALEQSAALSAAAPDRERRLLDAAVVLLNAADTTAAARVLATCQVSSARRDALTGLLEVYTGSPTAEARLLAAWEAHDAAKEREIGARAATSLTNWMVISGRPDDALVWADRAVSGTAPGSAVRAMARTAQAYAFGAGGRSPEGLQALTFLPAAGNDISMAETDALIMRGMLSLYSDDLAGAIADLGIAAARLRTGLPSTYPGPCLAHLSDAHFRRGDWDAAFTQAQLATSSAQDADRPLDLARAHGRAAQLLAFRGDWAAAQIHVSAALAAADRFPLVLAIAAAGTAAASLAFAQRDHVGVLKAVEPIRATRRVAVGGCPGIYNWRAFEVDALIGLGRLEDAQKALDDFEAAVPTTGLPSAVLALARCRGNLAVGRGQASEAETHFAHAHSTQSLVSMPFEQALLNFDPYVQACAAELAALEVTPVAGSSLRLQGLTRAELAVVRLVAAGMTNREVAGELFLSVKTVEYHLHNSYLKLNISSRRALRPLLGD